MKCLIPEYISLPISFDPNTWKSISNKTRPLLNMPHPHYNKTSFDISNLKRNGKRSGFALDTHNYISES